jgi:mannose-1-phosphate guanylyltransferase
MRGFVLAAGFGTRMRPLTDHIPKALVPVCGKPLLERALQFIHESGICEIGVNAHYLPDQIQKFKDISSIPFELFIESGSIRGTGGAFNFAREFLTGDTAFFMLNVDIVCKFNLRKAVKKFLESDSICMLIAFPCESGKGTILFDPLEYGYIGTPADTNRLPSMGEAAFIGAALYKKEFVDLLIPDDFSIVPVWKRAVEKGYSVTVYIEHSGFWRDIGNLGALADIHFDQLDGKIDLDIPSWLSCVLSKKLCIPTQSNHLDSNISGLYAWIETERFTGSTVKRSIVWPGIDICRQEITDAIITPFGVLPIS